MNTQTTTQNTPENNSEVTLSHYQMWWRKLRILWLSDPEKALQEITATMRYEDTLPYAIRKTWADAHHILDGVTNEWFSFEAPVVLIRGWEDIQSMLWDSGLQIKQDALFGKKIAWYDFWHNFFEKTKNKTKMSMRGSQSNLIFYIFVFIKFTTHIDFNLGLLLLWVLWKEQ